jgi:hypothetical protein
VEEILQDAPVAQIRGGFINIWDGVCERGCVVGIAVCDWFFL